MEKTCLECDEPLIGRSDKRFCSSYCRSAHNNRLNSDRTKLVRNTNNALRKNRRILEEINTSGKTKAQRALLSNKGFDFNLLTSKHITQKGKTYHYVYDQGYLEIDETYVLLVRIKT